MDNATSTLKERLLDLLYPEDKWDESDDWKDEDWPLDTPAELASGLLPDPCASLFSEKVHLEHWNRITDRLFLGGDEYQYDRLMLRRMVKRGITHFLDCRTLGELQSSQGCADYTSPELVGEFATNHTDDDGRKKDDSYFYFTFRWAERVLKIEGAKIYAHCAMGINRGPSNLYAILRGPMGMTTVDALTLIRTGRPGARVCYWRDVDRAVKSFYNRDEENNPCR